VYVRERKQKVGQRERTTFVILYGYQYDEATPILLLYLHPILPALHYLRQDLRRVLKMVQQGPGNTSQERESPNPKNLFFAVSTCRVLDLF
jgi:hypothetical protein